MYLFSYLGLALLAAAALIEDAPAIEIAGNKFFDSSTGEQFFIRGIAYQRQRQEGEEYDRSSEPGYVDLLANLTLCLRDLEHLKEVGVNMVRVYQVDPTKNHDICMHAFARNGIYVLVDLAEHELAINREKPAWDLDLYERYTAVVDAMSKYTNVLGFVAGNEVTTSRSNAAASAFVKAAIRDMKAYIRREGYRRIPVGYASNDDAETRNKMAEYFVCTDNVSVADVADFYALNMFEWCGYLLFHTLGYSERTIEFSLFPVPVFFSEYGCNNVSPRPFTEVQELYGPVMSKVWSGGIAYEFFDNVNKYGIVREAPDRLLVKLTDFDVLKLRLVESKPKGVHKGSAFADTNKERSCPEHTAAWHVSSKLPPTPNMDMCECLHSTLTCIESPYVNVHEHDLLAEVCKLTDCKDIAANGTTGVYGEYSGCSMRQRISYALNKYWLEQGKRAETCEFDGRAALLSFAFNGNLEKLYTSEGESCNKFLTKQVVVQQLYPNATWKSLLVIAHGRESNMISSASRFGVSLAMMLCLLL